MAYIDSKLIGFACSYTPLPLIAAAGFIPYRIFPASDTSDQAGSFLHDNICPHVKKVLDRALSAKIPQIAGMVFINSCDAMRRLSDAWLIVRPEDRVAVIDLPTTKSESSVNFLEHELSCLADTLAKWSGQPITFDKIKNSILLYRDLFQALSDLDRRAYRGTFQSGRSALQSIYNQSVTLPPEEILSQTRRLLAETETNVDQSDKVPIYLFGNVMHDPEAFALFDQCGVRILADDLCTGSRMHVNYNLAFHDDVLYQLAYDLMRRPACARTFDSENPGNIANEILINAKESGARGVIAHIIKFCDPYLARLTYIRETLRAADIPLLVLEGDCTLRSMGQFRTRIEAFVEMLR